MGLIEKMGRVGSRGTDKHRIAVERLPTSEQIALMFPPRPAISADRQPIADRKPSASSTGNPASRRPATAVAAEPSVEPSLEPSAISFDDWYEIFPRHEGKGAAKKAWAKALSKASANHLVAAAVRYRNDPNRDPAFTCLPATWLNQERWEDEALPSRNGEKPAVAPRSRRISEYTDEELEALRV
jgi:hypothetical protein